MIEKPFENRSLDVSGPLRRAQSITPSDDVDLSFETRAVYVANGGDLSVLTANGETVTLSSVLGGAFYPISIHRVLATGTTASGLVGLA